MDKTRATSVIYIMIIIAVIRPKCSSSLFWTDYFKVNSICSWFIIQFISLSICTLLVDRHWLQALVTMYVRICQQKNESVMAECGDAGVRSKTACSTYKDHPSRGILRQHILNNLVVVTSTLNKAQT